MAEPELLGRALPSSFFRRAGGKVEDDGNLALRFAPVLRGLEEFGLSERVGEYRYGLEDALQDLVGCIRCDGRCRSRLYIPGGVPMYWGLDRVGIRAARGRMVLFKAFRCPGVDRRKLEIQRLLVYRSAAPGSAG